ncbi:MAG TPA: hypothetical protein VK742_08725, partial [Candidatus Sulfotelmatobacter sp.]|nr:hypothetical protein [Candidatus Sulfotelmatobacter sp.]
AGCAPPAGCRPPCYPARPVNGGPFPKALPKFGEWGLEGKYNGWRAWVHNPTGAMFNRKLEPLSITDEFSESLTTLRKLPWEWSDVEALERRHHIGRGSLILLDYLPEDPRQVLKARKEYIHLCAGIIGIPVHDQVNLPIAENCVYLPMNWRYDGAAQLWTILQQSNAALGSNGRCGTHFWEGFVSKRMDSIYPRQNRNPELDFPFWMKHRWAF